MLLWFFIICFGKAMQVFSFLTYDIKTHYPEIFLQPLKERLGGVADVSFSHQQITKLGTLIAVTKYFQEKGLKHDFVAEDYKQDVYETILLNSEFGLRKVMQILELAVVSVDVNPNTSFLASAHFLAEYFQQANEMIRKMREQIILAIAKRNYEEARVLLGKVLHIIQDFYAHSNWLEMGKKDINYGLGYDVKDYGVPIAAQTEQTCFANCDKVDIYCTQDINYLTEKGKDGELEIFSNCTFSYFKCFFNVVTDKLTTMFDSEILDEQGNKIAKPLGKCNNGGILSTDALVNPEGGINKDSSFYFISPRAGLHVQASALAIKHTDHFVTWIRNKVGDEKFNELFDLNIQRNDSIKQYIGINQS